MPRGNPRPWFRPGRNTWYATIDGVQHNLRTPDKQTAYDLWHELMANGEPPPSGGGMLVVDLLALFADHSERNAKATTYNWYRHHLESFAKTISRTLEVSELKPFHVTRWLDRHSKWKSTTKHGAVSALKRAFQWAVHEGYIDRSPLGAIRKPPRERRETILSAEQRQLVLDEASDEEFRDYLTLLIETGARPQEVRIVEGRHVDLENGVWVLSRSEHKTGAKTDRPRVVYLTPKALAITRRLVKKQPQGPLLRNSRGEPWTKSATLCRFRRLRKRLKEKLPADLCSYVFRHSYATDALQRGVDPITVAELMGHADTTMVARVYQHIGQRVEHMREAARRATQSENAS